MAKHATGSKTDTAVPVKHQLIELFWTIGPAFTRWAESHMDREEFTPQRLRLMGLLLKNGPMMMCSLGDELGVTATNITALVDALEKDAMVVRKPHPSDRRATMIALTAKAQKQLPEHCATLKEKVSELFSDFPRADQEKLVRLLSRVREALVRRDILEASESHSCPKTATGNHS